MDGITSTGPPGKTSGDIVREEKSIISAIGGGSSNHRGNAIGPGCSD